MDAIYTLKALENQHRDATPEEQETLANYVGWVGWQMHLTQRKLPGQANIRN